MHIAVVSTFPPRQCGIATFSSDLAESLRRARGVDDVSIIAITNNEDLEYPPQVVATIRKEVRADYVRAARLTGRLGVDAVMVEHEFGIFGGGSGDFLLSFCAELPVPYVATLHTVLTEPSRHEDSVLRELCRRATGVLVFTDSARKIVTSSGVAAEERVHVVPHGAPREICELADPDGSGHVIPIRGRAGVGPADTGDRFVLSSFGLISPGKGLETAIDAVGRLAPRHPEVLLVLAGRTHPEVAKRNGEHYRLSLQARVRELGLEDQVTFDDRFLDIEELAALLAATDLFVTPYRGAEQTVSGALTFALAAGCPAVSTPFRYAQDLLGAGAGRLVGFDDPAAFAEAIEELIENPDQLALARAAACEFAASLTWSSVGQATAEVLRQAAEQGTDPESPLVEEQVLPPLRFDHLLTLVDDVGIVQHAAGVIPDRTTGYCVDDVARLLQVTHQLVERSTDGHWTEISLRAIAFLSHAKHSAALPGMRNFMSFDRRWIDEPHMGDHVGRSIWALGDLLMAEPPPAISQPATELLGRLSDDLTRTEPAPRTSAYAILGLAPLLERMLQDEWRDIVTDLTSRLIDLHDEHATDQWPWFEDALTYDNARLPQALVVAGRCTQRQRATDVGLAALVWYGDQCDIDGAELRLPGHQGRHRSCPHPGEGAEQPLDAAALVEAEIEALRSTGDPEHGRRAFRAFGWFLGRNRLRLPLYDAQSGGCRDGLEPDRVSANEGAESTLAYWTSRLALERAGIPVVARQALHET